MRTKNEARRQAILDSAAQVFQELGYERSSMAEICQRLGYSKATLYSYFASKDELFFEVVTQSVKAEFEATHAALDPSIDDITLALERFGRRFLGFLYAPAMQAVRRMLIAHAPGRASLGRACFERGPARSEAAVAAFLAQAMAAGKLRQADPVLAGQQLRSLLEAEWIKPFMFHLLDEMPEAQVQASVQRAVATFMAAYGPCALKPEPITGS